MIKSDKKNLLVPAFKSDCAGVTYTGKQLRGGNYSCHGYQKLEVPQSEAEKSNMPFTDPEFTYDSIS